VVQTSKVVLEVVDHQHFCQEHLDSPSLEALVATCCYFVTVDPNSAAEAHALATITTAMPSVVEAYSTLVVASPQYAKYFLVVINLVVDGFSFILRHIVAILEPVAAIMQG
jgi:hypothetical protein